MNQQRRFVWLIGALGGLLMAGCVFSYSQLASAKDQARRADGQHTSVISAIGQIEKLNGRPELASADTQRSARLTALIESTANESGIPSDQIRHIQTPAPRRLDGGPYLRQSKHVQIERATLPELLALLHDLEAGGSTLQLDELRLFAPHSERIGSRWRAEFTVSYLVYAPGS